MLRRIFVVSAFALFAVPSFGQKVTFGVIGGSALTNDYTTAYFNHFHTDSTTVFQDVVRSDARHFILGPTLDVTLGRGISIEADGLFRTLHSGNEARVTWEFPVLAKYQIGTGRIRPIVEGGPSFRTGDKNSEALSRFGFTAGTGVDIRAGAFHFGPIARYTRWGASHSRFELIPFKQDQLEVLVQVGYSTQSGLHPLSSRVSLGVVAGTTLTDDFETVSSSGTFSSNLGTTVLIDTITPNRRLIVGPSAQVRLGRNIFVEVDALYRPLSQILSITSADNNPAFPDLHSEGSRSVWEVPLIGGYRLPTGGKWLNPFVEGGASFRFPRTGADHGVMFGGGIETRVGPFMIAPTIRYTRWLRTFDGLPNQVEAFVQFSF